MNDVRINISTDLRVKLRQSGARAPERAHPNDAGLDLRAYLPDGFVNLLPQSTVDLSTGLVVCVPDGCVGFVKSRSGLAFRFGIWAFDGTIDASYRGELRVQLYNLSSRTVVIHDGDKIAQLVIVPVVLGDVVIVEDVDDTDRSVNGFGSTGRA